MAAGLMWYAGASMYGVAPFSLHTLRMHRFTCDGAQLSSPNVTDCMIHDPHRPQQLAILRSAGKAAHHKHFHFQLAPTSQRVVKGLLDPTSI